MTDLQKIKISITILTSLGIAKSQEEIGNLLGYKTKSSFSQILSGKTKIPEGFIDKLRGLHHSVNNFWKYGIISNNQLSETAEQTSVAEKKNETGNNENSAPYFKNINGTVGLNFLGENTGHPNTYIKIPGLRVDAYIEVFGDNMLPKYEGGQIIGIKNIEKEMIIFGFSYVVEMVDGESYIMYIKKGRDNEHWILDSENNQYESKEFHTSKIKRVFKIKSILTRESL